MYYMYEACALQVFAHVFTVYEHEKLHAKYT